MPNERIIYFGDTAHLPYGDKSEAAVQAYSVKIADVLLQSGCKVIVIACNSASSAAYDLLKEYVGKRAYVINVIDPMVNHLANQFNNGTVGLIGTKRTVESNAYGLKLENCCPHIVLHALATPLLVPMIEEGFFNNKISNEIINQYLSSTTLHDIEALVLGCTHYPLIKKQIAEFYNNAVPVLDSSEITAKAVYSLLENNELLCPSATEHDDHFYVSDYTESFEASTKLFFKEKVKLEKYTLWE